MKRSETLIEWSCQNSTLVVNLRFPRMDEDQINALANQLLEVGLKSGCLKYVLRFGPEAVECLYSVFLAKLIGLQRKLAENKIGLVLCELHSSVLNVFQVCKLDGYFLIADTLDAAVTLPLPDPLPGHVPPPCTRPRCGGPKPGEGPV